MQRHVRSRSRSRGSESMFSSTIGSTQESVDDTARWPVENASLTQITMPPLANPGSASSLLTESCGTPPLIATTCMSARPVPATPDVYLATTPLCNKCACAHTVIRRRVLFHGGTHARTHARTQTYTRAGVHTHQCGESRRVEAVHHDAASHSAEFPGGLGSSDRPASPQPARACRYHQGSAARRTVRRPSAAG